VVWKAAEYTGVTAAAPNATKDVAVLSFNAPSDGFVWVQASGYCNVNQGPSSAWFVLAWSTASAGSSTIPRSAFNHTIALSEASANTQIPYGVAAVIPVVAGATSLYLTERTIASGLSDCSGTAVLMFSPTLLTVSTNSGPVSSLNGVRVH
jgi:hypothetical protein